MSAGTLAKEGTMGNVTDPDTSRRKFIARAAYIAPAILTLQAASAYAKKGSVKPKPPKLLKI
jgi:hypothetical protein